MINDYLTFYAFLSKKDGETVGLVEYLNELGKLDIQNMDLHGVLITNAHTINCKNNKIIAIFATNAKQINCKNNNIKFLYAPLLKHLKTNEIKEMITPKNIRIYEKSNDEIIIKEKNKADRFKEIRGLL